MLITGNDVLGGNSGLVVRSVANPGGHRIFSVLKQAGETMMAVTDDDNMEVTDNIGVDTASPNEKLHVAGNICYTGSSSSCSDLRYKKDITVLPNVLEKLEQINGVYYNWKVAEFPENEFSEERQIGVIAQELEQVYPELVITDANGYKTVDYPKLTAILIEAVKVQNQQITNYESRITSNQHQINEIKALLEQRADK